MAYYEVYIPNEAEPRIYTAVRKLRNLPEGTIIWRNMESERYPVQVCNGRAKVLRRKVATPSNNRLQPTAFGVGTQAEFPLLGSSQADESSATNGGG